MMLFLHGYFSFWYKWKKGSTSAQAELVKLAPRIKHMDASGVQHKEVGKKTITPVRLTAAGFIAIAFLTFGIFPNPVSSDGLLASTAHAESKLDALIDPKIREWLDRLHKGEMPEGIAKTNGRIEATQIDVSAKYAGRLASVNVNEGDEVRAGQEIGRISRSPFGFRAAWGDLVCWLRAGTHDQGLRGRPWASRSSRPYRSKGRRGASLAKGVSQSARVSPSPPPGPHR